MAETLTQRHKHTKAKTQTHKDKDITTNVWASAAGQTRKDGPPLGSLLEALFKIRKYMSPIDTSLVGNRKNYLFETEVISNMLLPPIKVSVGVQEVFFRFQVLRRGESVAKHFVMRWDCFFFLIEGFLTGLMELCV